MNLLYPSTYLYIYIFICTYIYIYIHTHIYIFIGVYIHADVCTHVYVCINTHTLHTYMIQSCFKAVKSAQLPPKVHGAALVADRRCK